MDSDEVKPATPILETVPIVPIEAPLPVASEPLAPAKEPEAPLPPAEPSKPEVVLGRNGRPIISRFYAPLLALALLLPFVGCAGTAAGNALDQAAGIKVTINPDGTKVYEKLPTSPIQDAGGLFGPIGVLVSGLVAGGIYGIRLLGNSVPKDSHDKALGAPGPGGTV
jgi:hypothetical protein